MIHQNRMTPGTRAAGTCRRGGFTLIEILSVMAVVAMLAGIVFGLNVFGKRKALDANTRARMEVLRSALEEYRVENGAYPNPPGVSPHVMTNGWFAGELTNLVEDIRFEDAWGESFQYKYIDKYRYKMWSLGADVSDDLDNLTE